MVKKDKNYPNTRGISSNSPYFSEFKKLTENIRSNIIRLRNKKGLTQEQMEDFELSLRQIQRIESGETTNITLASLFKISKALGVKLSSIIEK